MLMTPLVLPRFLGGTVETNGIKVPVIDKDNYM